MIVIAAYIEGIGEGIEGQGLAGILPIVAHGLLKFLVKGQQTQACPLLAEVMEAAARGQRHPVVVCQISEQARLPLAGGELEAVFVIRMADKHGVQPLQDPLQLLLRGKEAADLLLAHTVSTRLAQKLLQQAGLFCRQPFVQLLPIGANPGRVVEAEAVFPGIDFFCLPGKKLIQQNSRLGGELPLSKGVKLTAVPLRQGGVGVLLLQQQLDGGLIPGFLAALQHFGNQGQQQLPGLAAESGEDRAAQAAALAAQGGRQLPQFLRRQGGGGQGFHGLFLHLHAPVREQGAQHLPVREAGGGVEKRIDQGQLLIRAHPGTELRQLPGQGVVHLVAGEAHHAGNDRLIGERSRVPRKGQVGKAALFVADEGGQFLESGKDPAPLLPVPGKIGIGKALAFVLVIRDPDQLIRADQAAGEPGQDLLVPLVQMAAGQGHAVGGHVRAAHKVPAQDPAAGLFVPQQGFHLSLGFGELAAGLAPKGKVHLQQILTLQKFLPLFRIRQRRVGQLSAPSGPGGAGVVGGQPRPHVQGADDAAVAEELMVQAAFQNPGKRLGAALVRALQDLLAQPLLESGCQQQLHQILQQVLPAADDDGFDVLAAELDVAAVAVNGLPQGGGKPLVPLPQGQGQLVFVTDHALLPGEELVIETAGEIVATHQPRQQLDPLRQIDVEVCAVVAAPQIRGGKLPLRPQHQQGGDPCLVVLVGQLPQELGKLRGVELLQALEVLGLLQQGTGQRVIQGAPGGSVIAVLAQIEERLGGFAQLLGLFPGGAPAPDVKIHLLMLHVTTSSRPKRSDAQR